MKDRPFDAPLAPTLFQGRAHAVRAITGRLNDANFSSTSVVGGPRSGKTSLLQYLASEAGKSHFLEAESLLRIYLDVEMLGIGMTPFDFWLSVLREMRPKNQPQDVTLDATLEYAMARTLNMFHLEDLFDSFHARGLRVVFFVDNWDAVLRNATFWPPKSNFLHLVRYFGQGTQRRTVAWVLSSQRPLLDLWDSSRGASPYYNIFETAMVGQLTNEDVKEFTRSEFGSRGVALSPEVEEFIVKASCGHPYLLNFLVTTCSHNAVEGADIGMVLKQLSAENGPLVSLIQQIRGSMSAVERQLFDKSTAVPVQPLTSSQADQLMMLASYGLLPPRPTA
jgi:hypothetical protein